MVGGENTHPVHKLFLLGVDHFHPFLLERLVQGVHSRDWSGSHLSLALSGVAVHRLGLCHFLWVFVHRGRAGHSGLFWRTLCILFGPADTFCGDLTDLVLLVFLSKFYTVCRGLWLRDRILILGIILCTGHSCCLVAIFCAPFRSPCFYNS